jgi:acyl-CoA-binding protein
MPAIAPITAAASGDNAVVPAVTNKKIRVRGYALYNGVATGQNAKWRSGTTDITGLLYGAAAIGLIGAAQAPANDFLFETVAGQALNLNLSAATATGGWVVYTLE